MSFANGLASLFRRDLSRVAALIRAMPSDEALWETPPGITNSAGNLALHIEGNLREYVGRQLGGMTYIRNRPAEFSAKGLTREELALRLEDVRDRIPAIVEGLSEAHIESIYPEVVLDTPMKTGEFLLHLYGHLNWHSGQLDYVRRVVASQPSSTSRSR